jgi:hypothetical protein
LIHDKHRKKWKSLTMDYQSFATGLSQETTQKIDELKRLVYKYHQYQNIDPDEIVRMVVYNCINGDNTLLNDKLEQLRNIDSRLNGWANPFTAF